LKHRQPVALPPAGRFAVSPDDVLRTTRAADALKLVDLGGIPLIGSPADFGKLIADETEKWGKVVKFAGIKPE
jgi:hypothetical protein